MKLIKTITRSTPTLLDKLGSFVFGNVSIGIYDENKQYSVDDFVYEITAAGDIVFYQCVEPTSGPFDIFKWNAVSLIDLIGSGDIISDSRPLGRTVSTWLKPISRGYYDVDSIPVEMDMNMLKYETTDDTITITGVVDIDDKQHFYGRVKFPTHIKNVSVSHVGENAFVGTTGITDLIISDNIRTIGSGAFRVTTPDNVDDSLYMLTVTIGNGISTIPNRAFYNQSKLTSITIPATIDTVDDNAFGNCTSLSEVRFNGKFTNIHTNAFSDAPLTTIYGHKYSTAEAFATEKNITFVEIE